MVAAHNSRTSAYVANILPDRDDCASNIKRMVSRLHRYCIMILTEVNDDDDLLVCVNEMAARDS